jgi:hypothetical protein
MTSKRTLSNIFLLFVLAILAACGGGGGGAPAAGSAPAGLIALPKTGQTTCFNTAGTVIGCTGTGQDGELQTGVAETPRFTVDVTGDCITDNLTGLMWPRNANLLAGTGAATTGLRTWQQALDYVNNLRTPLPTALSLCLAGDWRLPNRKELRSLISYNLENNAATLNTLGFSNVQAGLYWSSSSYAGSPATAWFVGLNDGRVSTSNKASSHYVWPVRAGQ